ncbi:MAG: aldolase [Pseudomonadota bacterium]|nr:aldolase [Pseudomonadota bacterium]MDE3037087.1 aldolase [Pseudomonadota bacterium]
MMNTILITNDPLLAAEAEAAGVARVMVDLESIGKRERQAGRNTFISAHRKEDIAQVRAALKKIELIVRVNPWHAGSPAEVEDAVSGGADFVMLPMITALSQLDGLSHALKGRVKLLPLVETAYSMTHIEDIAARFDIAEIYIGLNDLHLSLGLNYLFEPLSLGLVDWMADRIRATGKPFGFGGIGALEGGGELQAEAILAEHARLGSSRVILSSRFGKDVRLEDEHTRRERLAQALNRLQQAHERLRKRTPEEQEADRARICQIISGLAAQNNVTRASC